ncbi:MAG: phosphoribosyltransferase [Theionarchaea archaeon]|nr:phosphoribosyltransferase [Theionarchaea archaeon]
MISRKEDILEIALNLGRRKGTEEALKYLDEVFSAFENVECRNPDKTIFDYFYASIDRDELNRTINKLIEEQIIPILDKIDVLVTVDLTGTTIMREKMNEYKELAQPEIKIMKSSYVLDYDYSGKKVAIFDDGIRTAQHTIDVLKTIQKTNIRNIRAFYYIAGTDNGIRKLEDFTEKMSRKRKWAKHSILIHPETTYKNQEEFNTIYGRQICSHMGRTFMPVDKDHFYVECIVEGAKSIFDFWEIAKSLSDSSFIVNTDAWNRNMLKISVEYPHTHVERQPPCPYIRLKDRMLFKMRMFVNLDKNLLYLVPVVMDFGAALSRKPEGMNDRMCLLRNRRDFDKSRWKFLRNFRLFTKKISDRKMVEEKEITCQECGHMDAKFEFLKLFIDEFVPELEKSNIQLKVVDAGWDKIESKYDVPLRERVNNEIKKTANERVISVDESPRDHRFLSILRGSS